MRTRGKAKVAVSQQKQQDKSKQQKSLSVGDQKPKKATKAIKKQSKPKTNQPQIKQTQPIKEQKPKKQVKPKKYLNKNYDQISRIARSQFQRIYLLEAQRSEDGAWDFEVQGASGKNYSVHVHNTGLKCGCVDFRMKQKPCKHIYFIVTQVAQNLQILDYFNNSTKISKAAYQILDDQLSKRLKSRMQKSEQKPKQQIDLKDDTDCTICFTQMDKNTQNLQGCGTCKKYFHTECLQAWKKQNPTCPLCRSRFANVVDARDPLGKLQAIQIHSQNDQN